MAQASWAMGSGKKITGFFKGVSVIFAHIADPAMRYGTIYLMLATAIPAIRIEAVYQGCIGVIMAAPEFILLGAFSVAENAWKDGRKKWGGLLFVICGLLTLIMISTFVDIFIFQFSPTWIKVLNFCRCLVAFGFSVTMSKLEDESGHATSGHATTTTSAPGGNLHAVVTATPAPPTPLPAPQATTPTTQATPANAPTPTKDMSQQRGETDKLALTLEYLAAHPEIATSQDGDGRLAAHLGLQRPASARFWKLKALEMLQSQGNPAQQRKDHAEPLRVIHGGAAPTSEGDSKSRIIAYAQAHPGATRQEIATALGLSLRTVQRHLKTNATTDDNEQSEQDQAQA